MTGLPEAARRLLALAGSGNPADQIGGGLPRKPFLDAMGEAAAKSWAGLAVATELVGEVILRGGGALFGRCYARADDVIQLMTEAGAGA